MFDLPLDKRLTKWSDLRTSLEFSDDPLQNVIDFWASAPFIPHNTKLDRDNPSDWPSPWDIIDDNRYDDFTRAVMMGYTLMLSSRFENSEFQVKSMVDPSGKKLYNILVLDDEWVLNFIDSSPIRIENLPSALFVNTETKLTYPQ